MTFTEMACDVYRDGVQRSPGAGPWSPLGVPGAVPVRLRVCVRV